MQFCLARAGRRRARRPQRGCVRGAPEARASVRAGIAAVPAVALRGSSPCMRGVAARHACGSLVVTETAGAAARRGRAGHRKQMAGGAAAEWDAEGSVECGGATRARTPRGNRGWTNAWGAVPAAAGASSWLLWIALLVLGTVYFRGVLCLMRRTDEYPDSCNSENAVASGVVWESLHARAWSRHIGHAVGVSCARRMGMTCGGIAWACMLSRRCITTHGSVMAAWFCGVWGVARRALKAKHL